MPQPPEDNRPPQTAPRQWQLLLGRAWAISAGPIWNVLKYVLAALYFLFDETGQHVKRLAARFKPLRWYFGLIKLVRLQLTRRGLRSKTPLIRDATPFATLPFILVPGLALIPLKLFLVAYMLSKPLLGIAGIVAAKFFSAIFVKNTWDILRPVARRNNWLAWADDHWQWIEHWAKTLMSDLKSCITSLPGYQLIAAQARQLARWVKPQAITLARRARIIARDLIARLKDSVKS